MASTNSQSGSQSRPNTGSGGGVAGSGSGRGEVQQGRGPSRRPSTGGAGGNVSGTLTGPSGGNTYQEEGPSEEELKAAESTAKSQANFAGIQEAERLRQEREREARNQKREKPDTRLNAREVQEEPEAQADRVNPAYTPNDRPRSVGNSEEDVAEPGQTVRQAVPVAELFATGPSETARPFGQDFVSQSASADYIAEETPDVVPQRSNLPARQLSEILDGQVLDNETGELYQDYEQAMDETGIPLEYEGIDNPSVPSALNPEEVEELADETSYRRARREPTTRIEASTEASDADQAVLDQILDPAPEVIAAAERQERQQAAENQAEQAETTAETPPTSTRREFNPDEEREEQEEEEPPSAEDVDNAGKVPQKEYNDRIERLLNHKNSVKESLKTGDFYTSGDTLNSQGLRTSISPDVEAALQDYARQTGVTYDKKARRIFMRQVQKFLGISVDRGGYFMRPSDKKKPGKDADPEDRIRVDDNIVIAALSEMGRNFKLFGTPYRMPRDYTYRLGGTVCYTVPFPDPEEYKMFSGEGQPWHDRAYSEIVNDGVTHWNDFVHVKLKLIADENQRIAVEDIARAAWDRANTGLGYDKINVAELENLYIDEALNEMLKNADNQQDSEVAEAARRCIERLQDRARRTLLSTQHRGKKPRNPDGSISPDEVYKASDESLATSIARMYLSTIRIMGAADPVLLASSIAEKGLGSGTHALARNAMFAGNAEYKPTDKMIGIVKNEESLNEVFKGLSFLSNVAGVDAMVAFAQTGMMPTQENLADFGRTYLQNNPEKATPKVVEWANKGTQLVAQFFGGDWFMRTSDKVQFLNNFMLRQAELNRMGRESLTAEQVEDSMEINAAKTVMDMMSTYEGAQAYFQMRGRTLSGPTIASEYVNEFFRKHPWLDAAFATFCNKYLTFGIRAVRQYIPFINCIELAGMRNRAKRKGVDVEELHYSELLMSKTFRDALMLDGAYATTNVLKFLLGMAIIYFFGLQPPDEDDERIMWDEWRIGPTPEDSVPIRQMWYLDDLSLGCFPLAVATSAFFQTWDLGESVKILMDGLDDTAGSLFLDDVLGLITNFDYQFVMAQRYAEQEAFLAEGEQEAPGPTSIFDFMTTQIMVYGLERASDLGPRFFKQLMLNGGSMEDLEHTAYKRYTANPDDEADRTEYVSFQESQIRRITKSDPGLALAANIIAFITGESRNPEVQFTGYGEGDMPVTTITDPCGRYWVERFDIPTEGADYTKPLVEDDEIERVVKDAIAVCERCEWNPYKIAAAGVVLPNSTRFYMASYLKAQQNAIENQYQIGLATPGLYSDNGYSWEENRGRRNDAYNAKEIEKAKIQQQIDALWDTKIPSSPVRYAKWKQDYQQAFKDAQGTPITRPEYWVQRLAQLIPGLSQITGANPSVEYRNYGNFRNILQFGATTSENRYAATHTDENGNEVYERSFDNQTPVAWYSGAFYDAQLIHDLYKDAVFPDYGPYANQPLLELLYQEGKVQDSGQGWGEIPTIGKRGYVAMDEGVYDFIKPENNKDLWTGSFGEMGKPDAVDNGTVNANGNGNGWDYGNNGWARYPSRRYYSYSRGGGGGGGGGYNPKIYSYARTISVDRPTTMRSVRPYNANNRTYLRPAWQTKGSREAYRREDF